MKIIHVPFGFFPDPVGGTEVYVLDLAKLQKEAGHGPVIAAPSAENASYDYQGIGVRRFATRSVLRDLTELYDEGDESACGHFSAILEHERPDIVHLHAFTPAVSLRLVRESKRRGILTLFTYHTPTVSCMRGTMMRWGSRPCDGKLRLQTCARCTLHGLGLPLPFAYATGSAPIGMGRALRRWKGDWVTAVRMTELTSLRHGTLIRLFAETDHIVATAAWVRDVLLANGVPDTKITVSRQGVKMALSGSVTRRSSAPSAEKTPGVVRLVWFGRFDPTKGVDILIRAIVGERSLPVTLDLYGIIAAEANSRYGHYLKCLAARDGRISFLPPVHSPAVMETMARYDVLAAPSQWLETGPLVVLEAFAAGLPVIGSDRGGISEFVRDGIDGLLVRLPERVSSWKAALRRLVSDPVLLGRLRSGVRPPRSMRDVESEMSVLYRRVASSAAPEGDPTGRRAP